MSWKDTKSNMFAAVPKGNYPLVLESYEVKTTKPEKGSKLMYVGHFKVEDNDDDGLQPYVGRVLIDWMVVGTDSDPGAEEEETLNNGLNKGVAKIKRITEAAEVDADDPDSDITADLIEEVLEKSIGVSIIGRVKDTSPDMNNINAYFKVGEVQIGLDSPNKKAAGNKFKAKPETKSIHQLKTEAAAKKAKPVKAVVVDDDDDNDEDSLPPPKKVAGKTEKGGKKVECPMDCGQKVEYKDLAKHVQKCKGPIDEVEETSGDDDDED